MWKVHEGSPFTKKKEDIILYGLFIYVRMLYVDLGPLYQGFGMQTKHLSAASGAAGTFANSRVQNFSFPAIKRDANSSGHLPTTIDVDMHVYMQSFVHVYAMIITVTVITYYINIVLYIHTQTRLSRYVMFGVNVRAN